MNLELDDLEQPALWEVVLLAEFLAHFQPASIIHSKYLNRCTSDGRYTHDLHAIKTKVISPIVPARVKQRHNHLCKRVDTREVRALFQVASMARKSQIGGRCGATVLFGNDMFNVVCETTVLLPEEAILAAIASPPADQFTRLGADHG